MLGHAVDLLGVFRFGELLLEREVGVEHREIAVGLLVGDRVVGEAVAGVHDHVHDLFAVIAVRELFERIFQRYDGRFVAAYLIVGVCVQVGLVVQALRQFAVDLLEILDAVAVRVARHELVDGDQCLPGHRLVARGAGREVVEAECVHAFGVFDEGAAAELAAEIVEQGRGGVIVAVLELAAGVEERDAVFARRADVVVLDALEERRGTRPLLFLVVLQRLAVNQFGLSAFEQGVDACASAKCGDQNHPAHGV